MEVPIEISRNFCLTKTANTERKNRGCYLIDTSLPPSKSIENKGSSSSASRKESPMYFRKMTTVLGGKGKTDAFNKKRAE